MARPPFPFAFARDQGGILEANRLLLAPQATVAGLLEAQRRTEGPLRLERVSQAEFDLALTRLYGGEGWASPDAVQDQDEAVFDLEDESGGASIHDLLEDSADAPVIQLVNTLIRRTIRTRGSDLHIEPHESGLRARMRVDGLLQTVMDRDDVPARRMVSRLKVMAQLDIAETRLPQDGRIVVRFGGRAIDLRVSTLPGNYGERVVMRILDRTMDLMPLAELGLDAAQIAQLEDLAAQPNGIILATGATGSGKTTTLYSLLKLANRTERNIVTVEDPIEFDLEGISQSQINAAIGMTFAAGLRATLRQDPDVILVGEIRDGETASVAAQAALTGHTVFSSLHTNSTLGAITRLRDLGLEDYLIGTTLQGVIAQRLLRRLCPACKASQAPTPEDASLFHRVGIQVPEAVFRAVGCADCRETGLSGRFGVFEILRITPELRNGITEGASELLLERMVGTGSMRLDGQALMQVAQGTTSLDEVRRVLGDIL